MSNETERSPAVRIGDGWIGGVGAGVVGAAAMAALMLAMGARPVLAGAIPGLYGLAPPANPAAGVAVHLSHGAVLGVGFAGLCKMAGVRDPVRTAGAGVAYGVATWVLLAALVMPVWLSTVGFPMAPQFPNFAPPSLLWHVVYGGVLGGAFAAVR
jgi:hypothetical protein